MVSRSVVVVFVIFFFYFSVNYCFILRGQDGYSEFLRLHVNWPVGVSDSFLSRLHENRLHPSPLGRRLHSDVSSTVKYNMH